MSLRSPHARTHAHTHTPAMPGSTDCSPSHPWAVHLVFLPIHTFFYFYCVPVWVTLWLRDCILFRINRRCTWEWGWSQNQLSLGLSFTCTPAPPLPALAPLAVEGRGLGGQGAHAGCPPLFGPPLRSLTKWLCFDSCLSLSPELGLGPGSSRVSTEASGKMRTRGE